MAGQLIFVLPDPISFAESQRFFPQFQWLWSRYFRSPGRRHCPIRHPAKPYQKHPIPLQFHILTLHSFCFFCSFKSTPFRVECDMSFPIWNEAYRISLSKVLNDNEIESIAIICNSDFRNQESLCAFSKIIIFDSNFHFLFLICPGLRKRKNGFV